jgi:prolyl oligopeptidase
VPESEDPAKTLKDGFVAGGKLMVCCSKEGADALEVRSLKGKYEADVPVPLGSTVEVGQVRPKDKEFEVAIGGYLSPGRRYKYNVAENKLTFVKKSDIPRDLTEIADVERLYATSKDGTKVPMWVIKPKDMPKDGSAATILYGYGGFNISLEPGFSYTIAHWVEQGGVYVVANLRGGGEFGKAWYEGGRLKNKQNVFDDFAACAQELIRQGYTNPKRLAIRGASNGGLLTAATSQQYPELFGAVISGVPVTDMLRFHTDNYGVAWESDYGSPENKEDFEVLFKYSPLHNVKPAKEVKYPLTLIMTGDHDDRVAPWHAFKWAAARQEQGHLDNTYLRVDEQAGHGNGKPTQKIIEESVDEYAFLVQVLGPLRAKAQTKA